MARKNIMGFSYRIAPGTFFKLGHEHKLIVSSLPVRIVMNENQAITLHQSPRTGIHEWRDFAIRRDFFTSALPIKLPAMKGTTNFLAKNLALYSQMRT